MNKIISLLAIILILTSCGDNSNINYKNNKEGLRIVSLVPSVSRELVDLGLKENIVGATKWCDVSKNNKDLIIGTGLTANIEKIMLLEPDIVFATSITKENIILSLRNNGIKVHRFGKMNSYEDICSHFVEMGKIVGKQDVAEAIIESSKNEINKLIISIPKHEDKLDVLLQIGSNPIYAVTPNLFMDDYLTLAGCNNIMSDLFGGAISRESIIDRNPDVIIVAIMGTAGEKEVNNWKRFSELKSVENDKIYAINSKILGLPTVKTFTDALELIINKVYR